MIRTVGTLPTHILAALVHQGVLELVDRGVVHDAAEEAGLSDDDLQTHLTALARILGVASRKAQAIAERPREGQS